LKIQRTLTNGRLMMIHFPHHRHRPINNPVSEFPGGDLDQFYSDLEVQTRPPIHSFAATRSAWDSRSNFNFDRGGFEWLQRRSSLSLQSSSQLTEPESHGFNKIACHIGFPHTAVFIAADLTISPDESLWGTDHSSPRFDLRLLTR
jgi:hypothetical protein